MAGPPRELLRRIPPPARALPGARDRHGGDGLFATFDGPARAVRCASAITDAARQLGVGVRAGVHTGECEIIGNKVGGIAVHTGARVAAVAKPGEVLVSQTVKDLVAGSGLRFEERGAHALKGIPGEWRLFAVVGKAGNPSPYPLSHRGRGQGEGARYRRKRRAR
ncbi:MAG: adenylate/guanylate cyclase domain-containing protein [Candidatus Rokubacteria bacterium]|nr:adenylate/guanylate cyclase domain-containing protein [Candidatus Rokubacteria bacterium]